MKQAVRRASLLMAALAATAGGQGLVISEIMYHPPEDGPDIEYVEITNCTRTPRDISGYRFTEGFRFEFPPGAWIDGWGAVVVAKDPAAFESVYGFVPYGPFESGALDNGGERITLSNDSGKYAEDGTVIAHGPTVCTVSYNDRGQWPSGCSGTGHSLCLRSIELDPEDGANWSRSPLRGGTPGRPNVFTTSFEDTALVPEGAVWKFKRGLAEASEPIEAWRQPRFDDGDWEEGPAGFGYPATATPAPATLLADMRRTGSNPEGYTSLYIRARFTLASLDGIDRLLLKIRYDDGFVAYLNGREVGRDRVTAEPPLFDAVAMSSHSAFTAETVTLTDAIPLLVAGENVLCVQGFNRSITDADFMLHPFLLAGRRVEPSDPADGVVFNECYYHGAPPLWVELYNATPAPVALGGYCLARDAGNLGAFRIPAGTVLAAGGFLAYTSEELGFDLALEAGGSGTPIPLTLYLSNPALDRVVDARAFEEDVPFGFCQARVPDGRGGWFNSDEPTKGAPNRAAIERAVVINEIMYHPFHTPNPHDPAPAEGPEEREYLELYNNSDRVIDLSGWRFTKGIAYTFEEGALLEPRGYIVVARNPALLKGVYGLGDQVVGPYQGRLSNSGELIRLKDQRRNTVNEVAYCDGGAWPRWADGGGASLELVDPNQDNALGSAWAASDDRAKAAWTEVKFSGRHPGVESELQFFLTHRGEMLLDDVFIGESETGANRIANPGFESGAAPWRVWPGTHEKTRVVDDDAHEGRRSLLVAAGGRGDNWANNFEYNVTNPALTARVYHVRYWAKWQRGCNQFQVRSVAAAFNPANNLVYTAAIPVPENLGTPGARNSTAADNQGPVIGRVAQAPAVPRAGQSVTVTCQASDSGGIAKVELTYHPDTSPGAAQTLAMADDGASGDGAAGDGVWGAVIPAHALNTVVAFWITATDAQGAVTTFPPEGRSAPYVYQTLAAQATEVPVYRFIMRAADRANLSSRLPMSNSLVPMSFAYNDNTIYHNAGLRYRGSPWIRPGNRGSGYRVRFNRDAKLHGRISELNLDRQHTEASKMRDRTAQYLFRWLGRTARGTTLPYSDMQFVRVFDGSAHLDVYEYVQQVDQRYLEFWYGEDKHGTLYKIDDWFEALNDGNPAMYGGGTATFAYRGENKEPYRWYFKLRTNEQWDPYDQLIALTRFVQTTSMANLPAELPRWVDVEQWLGTLAVRLYIGDWDTIGYNRGKNAYAYLPVEDPRWHLLPWDSDLTFEANQTSAPLFVTGAFPAMSKMFNNAPAQRRMYQYYQDLVAGPAGAAAVLDFHVKTYSTFSNESLPRPADASSIRSFMAARNQIVTNQIPKTVFRIRAPASPYLTNKENLVVEMDVPPAARRILLDGERIDQAVQWTSPVRCRYALTLLPGTTTLTFTAQDAEDAEIGRAELAVTYSTNPPPQIAALSPAEGPDEGGTAVTVSGADFIEGAKVYIDGIECPETTFVDAATLTVVTPAASERGTRDVGVRVVNPDGWFATLAMGFKYVAYWPHVVSVLPDSAPVGVEIDAAVFGERFQEGVRIFFGERESPAVVYGDALTLTVRVPAGEDGGAVDVRALNPDGRSSILPAGFRYVVPEPEVTRISPESGDVGGGQLVEIAGRNFQGPASEIAVLFGVQAAEVREATMTRIVVVAPPAVSAGTVTVIVTDGGGRVVAVPGGYVYTHGDAPVFVRGDVNEDGVVNVSDAARILRYLFHHHGVPCEDAADVDDDGAISVEDAVRLLAYLFAGGAPPPPPFPARGEDPTPDNLGCRE
ncbi:MAG TPA: lamin tail domain-containing protein [Planctomycetota bacterium]|nr:lamin tail domain-containing protein [Planctomycetota bacterium]OQC19842.1 MAG: IPT/TIG domain protein [Planctomycetes bacterium ADurb.Bin069]HNR99456.1 lamin tail domain-containing protein [Planctomycetota bacterium]HNU26355.1 lamin tail domain-containing protein [Planctomycetota bacterium]HOE30510.1 lamin tail domain-containing protein [Planctomycetota bacterium]